MSESENEESVSIINYIFKVSDADDIKVEWEVDPILIHYLPGRVRKETPLFRTFKMGAIPFTLSQLKIPEPL